MEKQVWKIIAIVFVCLFIFENIFIFYNLAIVVEQKQEMNECIYNICSEYDEGQYEDNVCTCYERVEGILISKKTILMYD